MTAAIRPAPCEAAGEATEDDLDYCYRLLLGRAPDPAGRATWAERIGAGGLAVEDLVRGFVQGREFLARHRLGPAPGPEGPIVEDRRPPFGWRLARALIARSREHAFLDRRWIGGLLRLTPRSWRGPLALRLLSLSPHYWVYQWTNYYPAEFRRDAVLAREFARNAASRREICERVLRRFLRPGMTALDFGCGPGFLAREVSRHVGRVIAADVSRGVIACARRLNPAPNLTYVANRRAGLAPIADASIDLVYSFAVFQHLLREQTAAFFREFARVLKPGGQGVFHTILKKPDEEQFAGHIGDGWLEKDVHLRMVYLTAAEIRDLLAAAGFRDVQVLRIADIAEIDDDIGDEHLVLMRA